MEKIKIFFKNFDYKKTIKTFFNDCFKIPLYLITHPIKGFYEFKHEKLSKRYVAIFYLIMMIITQIIAFNAGGFLINKNNPNDFNIILTIALVIFPVIIFTIGNWASTALMDGKGKAKDIFRVITYSFFPYVWLNIFATIFSNFITLNELAIFNFFNILGIVLLAYMLFFGLLGIHEYGLLKTILMFVFTIVAIAVIIFIMLLFLTLINQVYSFFGSIYEEFRMRFL